MVGALPVMGSVLDSHTRPCLCFKSDGDLGFNRNVVVGRKPLIRSGGQFRLSSSVFDGGYQWRLSAKVTSRVVNRSRKKQRKMNRFVVVSELAGQYEDSFEDVKAQVLNYFTYKAVKTVLSQLYEMNPTQYRWLYDFVVNNKPGDGKRFLRTLVKEKQDLGERVMVTRLHLYGKWIKKCDHAAMYQEISDENLELMRERLMETVIWPSDDTNTEKIG